MTAPHPSLVHDQTVSLPLHRHPRTAPKRTGALKQIMDLAWGGEIPEAWREATEELAQWCHQHQICPAELEAKLKLEERADHLRDLIEHGDATMVAAFCMGRQP